MSALNGTEAIVVTEVVFDINKTTILDLFAQKQASPLAQPRPSVDMVAF